MHGTRTRFLVPLDLIDSPRQGHRRSLNWLDGTGALRMPPNEANFREADQGGNSENDMGWIVRLDVPARFKRWAPQWLTSLFIGLAMCGLALLARAAVQSIWPSAAPFGLLFPAILMSTLLGRWIAGLTCYLVGGLLTWLIFVPPLFGFGLAVADAGALLFTYFLVGGMMLLIAEGWLHAERKLAHERELRIEAEAERQHLLTRELNHRIKNSLAIVQAIALQTLGKGKVEPGAMEAFEERLFALARAHDLLTRLDWRSASLEDLIVTATAPFDDGARFKIAGPPAGLAPRQAVAISLGLHELATNALKYGALSAAGGTIAISWTVEDGRIHLSWSESGGPRVDPPAASGFGTRLLERGLAGELFGNVRLAWHPAGLHCDIETPAVQIAEESDQPT